MTTPVKPTAGSYLYFGSYLGTSYFAKGTFQGCKLYNRALSAAEVLHLYNGEPFVTESMGLIFDGTLDKGYTINSASLLGHNVLAGTTVKVEANDENAWAYPAVSEQFSYVASGETILRFLASTYTYKYWRFTFSGQASIAVGRTWLGEYLTIDPSSLLDFKITKKRSDTVIHGIDRQKFAVEGVGWRQIDLTFPKTDTTMIERLITMYKAVANHTSMIFCNFDDLRGYQIVEPMYCSLKESIAFEHLDLMKFRYSVILEEDR
jgi:hypothetical protein